jgi:hypothetical protein
MNFTACKMYFVAARPLHGHNSYLAERVAEIDVIITCTKCYYNYPQNDRSMKFYPLEKSREIQMHCYFDDNLNCK